MKTPLLHTSDYKKYFNVYIKNLNEMLTYSTHPFVFKTYSQCVILTKYLLYDKGVTNKLSIIINTICVPKIVISFFPNAVS